MSQIGSENNQPFWFQMSEEQRQQAGDPWGPANPQNLNRYAYVTNNPLTRTDPTGHVNCAECESGGFGGGIPAGGGATSINLPSLQEIGKAIVIAGIWLFNQITGQEDNSNQQANPSPADPIPQKARDVVDYAKNHNGTPPTGYKGGRPFDNKDGKLPTGKYKEYDVDPKVKGVDRNDERVVINEETGEAWYTPDHYGTFVPIP